MEIIVKFDSSIGEVPPTVIYGTPPIDLTAELATTKAALQTATTDLTTRTQELVTMTQERDAAIAQAAPALQAKIDAARIAAQAEKDADAASAAGQGVLDALAP